MSKRLNRAVFASALISFLLLCCVKMPAITFQDIPGVADAMNRNGNSSNYPENFEKELENYKSDYEIVEGKGEYHREARLLNKIGEVYLRSDNYSKAYEYLNKSYQISERLELDELRCENYKYLSRYYEKMGDAKLAHDYFVDYIDLKEYLYKAESEANLENLKKVFETEGQKKEIELLQKQFEVQEMEFRKQKTLQYFMIVILFMSVGIMFMLIWRFRAGYNTYLILRNKNRELENINEKLKISELSLHEMNATKDRFFSIIANDLKIPFNKLLDFSKRVAKDLNHLSDEELRENVSYINESSKKFFGLLENLLQWSAVQTKTLHMAPEVFDLAIVVKIEADQIRKKASKKNITVSCQSEYSEIPVYADKTLVFTTLKNLLDNALKFTYQDGEIKIKTGVSKDYAEVCVIDTGMGIEKEKLEKLFRIDPDNPNSGKGHEKGSGLGLVLCREFVELNGGSIKAESEYGKGSRFCFTIPRAG